MGPPSVFHGKRRTQGREGVALEKACLDSEDWLLRMITRRIWRESIRCIVVTLSMRVAVANDLRAAMDQGMYWLHRPKTIYYLLPLLVSWGGCYVHTGGYL
jgi:hypothetical protein